MRSGVLFGQHAPRRSSTGLLPQLPPQRLDLLFDRPVLRLLQRQEGAGDAQLLGLADAVVEVLAEPAFPDQWLEVLVGRAGDADRGCPPR